MNGSLQSIYVHTVLAAVECILLFCNGAVALGNKITLKDVYLLLGKIKVSESEFDFRFLVELESEPAPPLRRVDARKSGRGYLATTFLTQAMVLHELPVAI